jgi:hypothetical protein
MSEAIAVPGQSRILAALSASEMEHTQKQLVGFCQRKIQALRLEYKEAQANFDQAKLSKWRTGPFETAMRKTKKAIIYYGKMWAAVKAGYVIVPNFDAEVMAVRTDSLKPRHEQSSSRWGINRTQVTSQLPVGTGRYVDDMVTLRYAGYTDRSDPNKPKQVDRYVTDAFCEEIDFPISVVKPIVMDATQRAMALKIFDRVDVAGAARKDPIVLGRLMKSKNEIGATFFIAWWIDVNTL